MSDIEKGYNGYINQDDARYLLFNQKRCDKYDYLVSCGCGVIGGLIDVFLVNSPESSVAQQWTDRQIDGVVKRFAKISGWKAREGKEDSLSSAIGFLEKKYRVNYDQRYSADVNDLFHMTTKNHHLMSLGHSPDIFGLFFSLLNQFTSTSTFIANGRLISVNTDSYELRGNNFISQLFCGIMNWFGHIMSDIAGSSGSSGRGTGVAIPFFRLFQLCTFGEFSVKKDRQDLATIAIRTFQEGYDFRFGLAMTVPVIITELLIKTSWALRSYFVDKQPIERCIPILKNDRLRMMLLVGNGTLCALDGAHAFISSSGNWLLFFAKANIIVWFRLLQLVLKELCLRFGIIGTLEKQVLAMECVNQILIKNTRKLEEYDIQSYQQSIGGFLELDNRIKDLKSEEEVYNFLEEFCIDRGHTFPWKGSFDQHMENRQGRLRFE